MTILTGKQNCVRQVLTLQTKELIIIIFIYCSKKDIVQRRKELLDGISPGLLELVKDHGEELMFDKGGCQLILAILLKCSGMSIIDDIAARKGQFGTTFVSYFTVFCKPFNIISIYF